MDDIEALKTRVSALEKKAVEEDRKDTRKSLDTSTKSALFALLLIPLFVVVAKWDDIQWWWFIRQLPKDAPPVAKRLPFGFDVYEVNHQGKTFLVVPHGQIIEVSK